MPSVRTFSQNLDELSQPVRESPDSGGAQQANVQALPASQPSASPSTNQAAGASSPLAPAASSPQAPAAPALPFSSPIAEGSAPASAPSGEPAGAPQAPKAPQVPSLGNYANLFKPVVGGLGGQYGKLSSAVSQFNQGAGANRSYDTSGAQGALQQAADRGTAGDISAAQGFLGSKYTGPTQLDPAVIADLQNAAGSYRATLPNLGSVESVVGLLGQSAPNLTRGEKYFEARNLWNDPQFRATAQSLGGLGSSFGADVTGAENQATAYAAARGGQESDIASRSQQFLQSLKDQEKTDLQARATEKQTGRQSLLDQISAFTQSGDISKLQGLQGAPTAEQLQGMTPAQATQAQKALSDIQGRYQDIKDVPELTYRESRRGNIVPILDPDSQWYKENRGKLSSSQLKQITDRAVARNKEYQDAGLVGKQVLAPHLGGVTPEQAPYAYGIQPGALEAFSGLELGGTDPVYGTGLGAYAGPDARSVVDITGGNQLPYTPENVASETERDRYNRIASLLGLQDQLAIGDAPVDPSIVFHPERANADAEVARRQAAVNQAAQQLAANEYARIRGSHHAATVHRTNATALGLTALSGG